MVILVNKALSLNLREIDMQNEVSQKMKAAGYTANHTGGGCMAWQKGGENGGWFITICDEGNGLGDTLDELYMVGLYHNDGDFIDADDMMALDAAIAWGEAAYAEKSNG